MHLIDKDNHDIVKLTRRIRPDSRTIGNLQHWAQ